MIYIFTFIISILILSIALYFRKKNKILFLIFSILGLAVPCILAALRDNSIGTDVNVYIYPLFKTAKNYEEFSAFCLYKNSSIDDILYLLTTFICAKFSNEASLLYFVNEALVIVPLYIALLKMNEKNNSIIIGMFIFFMFFYNQTFNMARQSIAISFALLSLSYIITGKSKRAIFTNIIACLFHKSAIINFLILMYYKLLKNKKISNDMKKIMSFAILVIVLVSVIALPQIMSLLASANILASKFNNMLANSVRGEIVWTNTLFYIFIWMFILLNKKKFSAKIQDYDFFEFLSLLSVFILHMGVAIKFSDRIGYYVFYAVLFFLLPKLIPENSNCMKKNEVLNANIIIAIFIVYWVFWIIIQRYHETYPYIFYIQ